MGGKNIFRTAIFIAVIILALSLFAVFASAGTCIADNNQYCIDATPSISDPCDVGETYDERSQSQIPECNLGCCCDFDRGLRATTSGFCDYAASINLFTGPGNFVAGQSSKEYCDALCEGAVINDCNNLDCNGVNSQDCICGTANAPAESYCCAWDNEYFSDLNSCLNSPQCRPGSTFNLTGIVIDQVTGVGLGNVAVEALGRTVYTSSDGTFNLPYLVSGPLIVTASLAGYISTATSLNLNDNKYQELILVNLQLTENCEFLSGQGQWDDDGDVCWAVYDSDCSSNPNFKSEADRNLCQDNQDNDCDGQRDCADSDCFNTSYCQTGYNQLKCGDGIVTSPNFNGILEECEVNSDCDSFGQSLSCVGCKCVSNIPTECGDGLVEGAEQCDRDSNNPNQWIGCNLDAGQQCDTNTCLCTFADTNCGDSVLNGSEECEFTNSNYLDTVSGSYCGVDQCIKPGEIGECYCRTTYKCGNGQLNPEQGEQCDRNFEDSCQSYGIWASCNLATCICDYCDASAKVPSITKLVENSATIDLGWTQTCPNAKPNEVLYYVLSKCVVASGDVSCTPDITVVEISGDIQEETYSLTAEELANDDKLCFGITANYQGSQTYTSINGGNCMEGLTGTCLNTANSFCENNAVKRCVAGNAIIEAGGDCQLRGEVCINNLIAGSDAGCVAQSSCELCNGMYGMFSSLNPTVTGLTTTGATQGLCSNLLTCYMDTTETTVDKYYGCSDVTSCYDYNSQASCGINKCNAGGADSCEWLSSISLGEVGIGVCRPKDKTKRNCERCTETTINNFFGECNLELCELYDDDCYFVEQGTNIATGTTYKTQQCVKGSGLSCADYISQDHCIGYAGDPPRNFTRNNVWVNGEYFSGDNIYHSINDISNDYLGFGRCVWDGEKCFKDGNGNKFKDCGALGDGSGPKCERDFNDPRVVLELDPNKNYILKKHLGIGFSIIDQETLGGKLHYNLVEENELCYPNKTIRLDSNAFSDVIEHTVDQGGRYTLCYFAEDRSANFGELESISFAVDTTIPKVTYELIEWGTHDYLDEFNNIRTVSDINISVTANETVTCTFFLVNNLGPESLTSPYVGGIKTTLIGQNFNHPYKFLEDSQYTFHANCSDAAGNQNPDDNKTFSFVLDADKTISNLQPSMTTFGPNEDYDKDGLIQITLSATTQEPALECRYGPVDDFNIMTPLDTTNNIIHTKVLEFNFNDASNTDDFEFGSGVKNYYIRCNFTEKGVYGSPGDYVMFAIDDQPPVTSLTNGEGFNLADFDANNWYREVNLFLNCVDTPMYYLNNPLLTNFAVGCEVYYAKNTAPTPTGTNIFEVADISQGSQLLNYYSVDEKGNTELTKSKPIHIDDQEFDFIFEIYDEQTKSYVSSITWGKNYKVYIESTKRKPAGDISYGLDFSELYFVVGSRESFSIMNDIVKDYQADALGIVRYVADLRINQGDIRLRNIGLSTGTFYVTARDTHNIESSGSRNIILGKTFTVDLDAPDTPLLDPSFEGRQNSFEDYYPEIFNEYDKKYYTNAENLLVTGKTKADDVGLVYYYINDIYHQGYDMSNNAQPIPSYGLTITSPAAGGESSFLIEGDVTSNFADTRYVKIVDDFRTDYGHFKEYYQIQRTAFNGIRTEVFLETPLEREVAEGTQIELFDARYPYTWFGLNLSLLEGWNSFSVKLIDEAGNLAPPKNYDIFLDPTPPRVSIAKPQDDYIIPYKETNISINIIEEGSGLEEWNFIFSVSGNLQVEYINETTNNKTIHHYTFIYNPIIDLPDAVYNVSFKAADYASNKIEYDWSFEIDSNAPQIPIFEFVGINTEEQRANFSGKPTWFFTDIPDFTVEYPDNADVFIERVQLMKIVYTGQSSSQSPQGDIATCTLTSTHNLYSCTITDQSAVSEDGDYALRVYAYKQLTGNLTTASSHIDEYFTIDKTTPEYTLEYDNVTNSNANLEFRTRVNPGEKILRAFIEIDGDKVELEPKENWGHNYVYLYSKPFNFDWEVPDEDSQELYFTFYLRDIAGNEQSSQHMITIDNIPPVIRILEITTKPGFVRDDLNPYKNRPEDISPTDLEHGRFANNKLELIGEIVEDSQNGYDINQIVITKRNKNGTLYNANEDVKPIRECQNSNVIQNCFYQGELNLEIDLKGELGIDTPNYLLFRVTDEGDNIAYFTLFIVSDMTKPAQPKVYIDDIEVKKLK